MNFTEKQMERGDHDYTRRKDLEVEARQARLPRPTPNYRPVVGSLLSTLQHAGFELVSVEDGGAWHTLEGTPRSRRQAAKAAICAVQDASLFVRNSEGKKLWLYIVLGNEPEEIVSDFTVNLELEKAIDKFSQKWEGKPTTNKVETKI